MRGSMALAPTIFPTICDLLERFPNLSKLIHTNMEFVLERGEADQGGDSSIHNVISINRHLHIFIPRITAPTLHPVPPKPSFEPCPAFSLPVGWTVVKDIVSQITYGAEYVPFAEGNLQEPDWLPCHHSRSSPIWFDSTARLERIRRDQTNCFSGKDLAVIRSHLAVDLETCLSLLAARQKDKCRDLVILDIRVERSLPEQWNELGRIAGSHLQHLGLVETTLSNAWRDGFAYHTTHIDWRLFPSLRT